MSIRPEIKNMVDNGLKSESDFLQSLTPGPSPRGRGEYDPQDTFTLSPWERVVQRNAEPGEGLERQESSFSGITENI